MKPALDPAVHTPTSLRRGLLAAAGTLLAGAVAWPLLPTRAGAAATVAALPPPEEPAAAAGAATETAVLAGGCFWGVQGVFQHVEGVLQAVSGYAGGDAGSARYDAVGSGRTGHAEAVRVTFDPRVVAFGQLLQVFFAVVHDPTEVDRQGPDIGTQYRSAVFAQTAAQARIARAYIARLDAAGAFGRRVATTVETDRPFYPAEAHHQDFLARHPGHPYIAAHDLPKVAALQRVFPGRWRASPVLVGAPG